MNYADHCLEQNIPPPKEPVVFSKFSSAIIGPYDDLKYPEVTEVRITLMCTLDIPRFFFAHDLFDCVVYPI